MPSESARERSDGRGPDDVPRESGPRTALAELAAVARVSAPQALSPIPGGTAPETREFAETLRVLFGALGMSLNRLAALLHSDPGTVSRYLSGKRIPPPDFTNALCKAVYDAKGSLITAQVQELVHEQFLDALRKHNPARYEVQRLTDLLQTAAQEKQQYQITMAALEEAIANRNDTIYALELESRQLRSAWARAEGRLEEEEDQRMHPQETIDSLRTQVSYFKEQLLSAQRRAAEAEDRCRKLEARLDAAGALLRDDDLEVTLPQVTAGLGIGPALTGPQQQEIPSSEDALPSTIRESVPDIQSAGAGNLQASSLAVTKQSNRPGWWQDYNELVPDWFHAYVGMEYAARSIHAYETRIVPGLLQTEEYATAVISVGDFPTEKTERLVVLRRERQRRFRDGELELIVILDEAALHRPIGGTAVQLGQLRYLREACASPTLTLRVLPYGTSGHAALTQFNILRFAEHDVPDVVYVENLTSALYLDKQADVDRYLLAIEHLSAVSAAPHRTLELLDQLIADLETAPSE